MRKIILAAAIATSALALAACSGNTEESADETVDAMATDAAAADDAVSQDVESAATATADDVEAAADEAADAAVK